MRRVIILVLTVFICKFSCIAQLLEGEWKGSFTDSRFNTGPIEIIFNFIRINDSTFQAFSKTLLSDGKIKDSAICILTGGFIKKNILYLEESKAIKGFSGEITSTCMQLMKFYYYKRKKQLLLQGEWYTEENSCGYGNIQLSKKL
jgi:hypothetical protein